MHLVGFIIRINRENSKVSQETCSTSRLLLTEVVSFQGPYEVALYVMRGMCVWYESTSVTATHGPNDVLLHSNNSGVSGDKTYAVVFVKCISIYKMLFKKITNTMTLVDYPLFSGVVVIHSLHVSSFREAHHQEFIFPVQSASGIVCNLLL